MKRGEVLRDFLPAVSPAYFFSEPKFETYSDGKDLTNVLTLRELPSLSVCLDIRSKLSRKELEGRGNDCIDLEQQQVQKFVVKIPGLGTFDREGVQQMVRLHDMRRTVREVDEERLWLENVRRYVRTSSLLDPVEFLMTELWSQEENHKVFGHTFVRDAARLCCDRWFSDDLIEQFFMKLNAASETHLFLVFSELMTDTNILKQTILRKLTPHIKFVHFAVNVRGSTEHPKCGFTETQITNGNHWVYVMIRADGSEAVYGDPKGWAVPRNFKACFEPLVTMLKERSGRPKSTLKLTTMHVPRAGSDHKYVKECSQLFPVQTCQSLCGGIVVLIATLALSDVELWNEMVMIKDFSRPVTKCAVRDFLRNPSSNSYTVRALLMSWLVTGNILGIGFNPIVQSGLSTSQNEVVYAYDETEFPPLPHAKHVTSRDQNKRPGGASTGRDVEITKEVRNSRTGFKEAVDDTREVKVNGQPEKSSREVSENDSTISSKEIGTPTKRKGTDVAESVSNTKAAKTVEKNTCAGRVEPLPFQGLSRQWYGLQAKHITKESGESLPEKSSDGLGEVSENDSTTSSKEIGTPTKRKSTDVAESVSNTKAAKTMEKNTCADRVEPLPFQGLSRQWYGLQAKNFNKESEGSLPFPELSRKWYGEHVYQPSSAETSKEERKAKNTTGIPLEGLSRKWYGRRGMLRLKNQGREKTVRANGSIQENIESLEEEKRNSGSSDSRRIEEITRMIEVGRFIERHGPIVPTQEIGKLLTKRKNKPETGKSRRPLSAEIYKKIQRHLNVIQVYVRGTGFLIENKNQHIPEIMQRLESIAGNLKGELNANIASNIGPLLATSLKLADTKKDADLIKGLFAKATSVKFVSKVLNVKNKNYIRSAKDEIDFKVAKYKKLEFSSQIVRNDMTNEQQRRVTRRIVAKRKQSAFKLKYESRGRPLLADVFPELWMVLEEIFNRSTDGMLGGLESHPRLTSD